MYRHKNYHNDIATLFLIPTPIGNLEDITLRALDTLKRVDHLYAEDTRVSAKLLRHFEINKELKSFHEHNETQAASDILDLPSQNETVGLISDAGMPLLSDPGSQLVSRAIESGYNVVCLPGPSASLTGLLMSGMKPHPFLFYGFLDPRQTRRLKELEKLAYRPETLVFYEAPHRLSAFMSDLEKVFPAREVAIVREISKNHEELIRGKPGELTGLEDLKGEMVVIVEGYEEDTADTGNISIVEQVDWFIRSGMTKTEAMKKVADMTSVPKNKIYQEYLEKTKKQ